jgi:serine/threonine protein kinase/tetratricopeptide (TPR) repeat protein
MWRCPSVEFPAVTERSIFLAALDINDPDERAAYVARACGDDTGLRTQVESLLKAHGQSGGFMGRPAPALVATMEQAPLVERPGAMVGPYKLLEMLGEGGFGVVFMAEQVAPVRRKVALKILKAGMDTKQVVARFEAERQALAIMDHPNIAKVFDGGATESGRPYFVMELIKGTPITEFCDQNRLTPQQRLGLFIPVCQAVQHAHQKGIIHRDLKPTNVLVSRHDTASVVKVIDFGVAKAMGQELTDNTLFTGIAQMIGTPLYMSPEQAGKSDLDIDTRSDIYSLGVLLYELLTGTTPFTRERFRKAAFEEIRRIIREEEPPKPSTRLSDSRDSLPSISTLRQTESAKLTKLVRGELDWIVMKALEKDRNRRYETANGLAMDVQRYLADEAVLACPPSASYRLRKFATRHAWGLAVAALMLAVLLAATLVSTWQAVRAWRAERATGRALLQLTAAQAKTQVALTAETTARRQSRESLDALTDDVVETMFTKQERFGEAERSFLKKVLGFYEAITKESGNTSEARFLRAKGYFKVAHLRSLLGEQSEAVAGFRQAESLLEQLAAEYPETAEYRQKLGRTEGNLAVSLAKLGKQADAEAAFRRGITVRTRLVSDFPLDLEYGMELANNYNDLGFLRELQHNYPEAEGNYRRSLDLKEKLVAQSGNLPRYRMELIRGLSTLGQLLRIQEKYAESEKLYREAATTQEEQVAKGQATAKDRQRLADSYSGLGIALAELTRQQEAEDALRHALEVRRKLVDDFPSVLDYRLELASATNNFAYLLTRQGNDAAAEEPYRQVLELRKGIVKQGGPIPENLRELAMSYHNLAWVHRVTGRPKEAESLWRDSLEIWRQLLADLPHVPDYHDGLAGALGNVAKLQNQRGEFAAAAALLESARPHLEAALDARPKDRGFRESHRDYFVTLGENKLGLADHVGAAATAAELARFAFEPAKDQYSAASLLARCVKLASKDATLPEARRDELAQNYSQQALAFLRQAVMHGFKDLARLKEDADLEPLRAKEEFRKLVADLEEGSEKK